MSHTPISQQGVILMFWLLFHLSRGSPRDFSGSPWRKHTLLGSAKYSHEATGVVEESHRW